MRLACSLTPTPMDTPMSVDSDTRMKKCKTCRKTLSIYNSFKNCVDCRARNRTKETHRAERRRETEQFLAELRLKEMRNASPTYEEKFNAKENPVERRKSLSTGTMMAKPRLPKLHELEGKEKKAAIQEMKVYLIEKIQNNSGRLSTTHSNEQMKQSAIGNAVKSIPEFQTASTLYEKLRVRASRASDLGKNLTFHGCHSIVAVPAINHQQRVAIVAKDLHKIARISFINPSRKSEKMSDDSLFQTYFDCNCLGTYSTASGTGEASKGTLKHLVIHPTDKRVECGGTVKVTAQTDSSHPAGIIGQKISVHIYH